jgi:hypothetical protein
VSEPLLFNKERTFQSAEAKDAAISDSTTAAGRNMRQEKLHQAEGVQPLHGQSLRKLNFIKWVPTAMLLLTLPEPSKRREQ